MRWLGRGQALYKLSIGGHSALVSKDHVCESGFPVRKTFARDCGYLPCCPFRGPRRGMLSFTALGPPPRVAGRPSREHPWGGEGRVHGRRCRQGLGRGRGRPRFRGSAREVREAPTLSRAARSRPGVGKKGGGDRAWPGAAGPVASLPEGGLARSGFRRILTVPLAEGGGACVLKSSR